MINLHITINSAHQHVARPIEVAETDKDYPSDADQEILQEVYRALEEISTKYEERRRERSE